MAKSVRYGPALKKAGQRRQQFKKSIKADNMRRYYRDIEEFGKYLDENPGEVTTPKDSTEKAIKHRLLQSSSGSNHILFWDDRLLEEFTTEELFIDGTFKSRPNIKGVAQLLTILGRKNNVVSI